MCHQPIEQSRLLGIPKNDRFFGLTADRFAHDGLICLSVVTGWPAI
jgi:hypothetical protein